LERRDNIIPIEELIAGAWYKGKGRNFDTAQWRLTPDDSAHGAGFFGQREKWGCKFEDRELHWDSDPKYGTFQPLELLEIRD